MSAPYNHTAIEEKWLHFWEEHKLFQGTATQDCTNKEKLFLLFAFAYPSGAGLHVGHVESKTALDILARYNRMNGKSVFFPVGWDAFGLPAENYAVKTGIHPAETTKNAIHTFRRQIKRVGISYDWEAEIATCHPEYYKWTQWIFLELYKAGLAYQALGAVNWCPSCQTVLANEQVVNGRCERCESEVLQKEMKQWFFKITEYKDELISGLNKVDWPEPTKQQQLNWIGKKHGINIRFKIKDTDEEIVCFTTRPDTNFGVTFIVLAPEHPFVQRMIEGVIAPIGDSEKYRKIVADYTAEAKTKTELQRQQDGRKKTGAFTGYYAINSLNGREIPIWVSDFVLAGFGTGAVMGVPGHDKRDFEFAQAMQIPIVRVVTGENGDLSEITRVEQVKEESGKMINSGFLDGMEISEATHTIMEYLSKNGDGEIVTTYKLRDWLISRQRYWGVPIPIVYDPEGVAHPVKNEHLPWVLPTDVEFKPTGESPLTHSKEFIERTERLYGKGWRPEFDTMDTFVDSSWYFLRYTDARTQDVFASPEQIEKWLPVNFYMIGPEHIVLHLLYSRFFVKFLRDQGYLHFDEPFLKMRHQGMILGPDGKKMSKSKGNVINPDDIIEKFGADTLRMYEMFMGPIEADKPWDVSAVAGIYRFLQRVQNIIMDETELGTASVAALKLRQAFHRTIKKVTEDIPLLKFNTAIAAIMEFLNNWESMMSKNRATLPAEDISAFIRLVAPFCPFIAEDLAHQKNVVTGAQSVHQLLWPIYDPKLVELAEVNVAVQVNGKLRGTMVVASQEAQNTETLKKMAADIASVKPWITEKEVKKVIVIPGKIVNFVI